MRATKALTGVTTKKYTAAATNRNETSALMKSPTANTLPFTVKLMAEKSGLPTSAAISGVSKSLVKAETTVANAAPITTPNGHVDHVTTQDELLEPFEHIRLLVHNTTPSTGRKS